MIVLEPQFEADHVRIHIVEAECISPSGEAGDKGIIFGSQTTQHVGDHFFIFKAFTDGRRCVREALDPAEVVIDGEILLLDRGELHANLHHLGTRCRRERPVDGAPDFFGGGAADDLREYTLGEGGQDRTHHELVLLVPVNELGIGDGDRGASCAGLRHSRRRSCDGAVDVPYQPLASKVGEQLRGPEKIVVTGQLDGDHLVEGGNLDPCLDRCRWVGDERTGAAGVLSAFGRRHRCGEFGRGFSVDKIGALI